MSHRLKLDPNPSQDIWTYKHTNVRLENKQHTIKLNLHKLLKRQQNSKKKTQLLSSSAHDVVENIMNEAWTAAIVNTVPLT